MQQPSVYSSFEKARYKFRDELKKGIKPVDSRQPIPDELAKTMVQELIDLEVPKNALIGIFDAFLILSTHLKEAEYTNLVLLENSHKNLTNTQEKYYNNIRNVCENSGIKYYVPTMNNYDRCDMKFDVIIGNPPYQFGIKSSGNTIWDKFVSQSLELLNDGGILSFINPPRWRQPEDNLSYIYKKYQLISLKINDVKTGKKVFNAMTPFDVYTIKKAKPYTKTYIEFSDGICGSYNVNEMPFIPNSSINFWLRAFESKEEKLSAIWTYSHDPRHKHVFMESTKPSSAIYPLTHTFTKNGFTKRYTTKKHEYQEVSKVIFGDSGSFNPIFDEGTYGCTQHSIFIPVSDKIEGNKIIDFLTKNKNIIDSITFSQRQFGPKPLNFIPKSFL